MKKFKYLLIPFFFIACSENEESIVTQRYVDDVFTEIEVTSNIKYGENKNLLNRDVELFADIYEPIGDNLLERPLILLAHGGAFISGNKNDLEELCIRYARKGFVVASISYRLIDVGLIAGQVINDSVSFSEGVVFAMHDMKAAIRYLRNDAINENSYNIDPNTIFVGGVSAGAVMACNIGLLSKSDDIPVHLQKWFDEHGGIEGNSNSLTISSEVSGILSYSGSVFRNNWISANDPPIFLVHEEFDAVVPCNYESTDLFPFEILSYGSCEIFPKAQELGLKSEFLLYEGSDGHVSYFLEAADEESQAIVDQTSLFLFEIISE